MALRTTAIIVIILGIIGSIVIYHIKRIPRNIAFRMAMYLACMTGIIVLLFLTSSHFYLFLFVALIGFLLFASAVVYMIKKYIWLFHEIGKTKRTKPIAILLLGLRLNDRCQIGLTTEQCQTMRKFIDNLDPSDRKAGIKLYRENLKHINARGYQIVSAEWDYSLMEHEMDWYNRKYK